MSQLLIIKLKSGLKSVGADANGLVNTNKLSIKRNGVKSTDSRRGQKLVLTRLPSASAGLSCTSACLLAAPAKLPNLTALMLSDSASLPIVSIALKSLSDQLPSVFANLPQVSVELATSSSRLPSASGDLPSLAVSLPSLPTPTLIPNP